MFYEVKIIDGEACITGLTNNGLLYAKEHRQMPEFPLEFDGLPVTRIEDYAFFDKGIKRLPESWGNITTLGAKAFATNEISEIPEDWGIVSGIGDSCFQRNNIKIISNWGIIQEVGKCAFYVNDIEKISDWGDLRSIRQGAFCSNNISELTASFRGIKSIEAVAFAGNNILGEIGDMYMVPKVKCNVFDRNPGARTLFKKYLEERKRHCLSTGD